MNVAKNCKQYFETEEEWELFLKGFTSCVFAKTIEEYDDVVEEWKADFHWNNGVPHTTSIDSSVVEIQVCVEKEAARQALAYCLGS